MKLTHNFERMIRVELDSFGLNPDDEEEKDYQSYSNVVKSVFGAKNNCILRKNRV